MHELSIAYDIVKTAQQAALDNHAFQVKKVCVDIGEMSMVNPEQVQFLFDTLVEEDPVLKGAVLESRVVAPETRCTCGYQGRRKICLSGLRGAPGTGPGQGDRGHPYRDRGE